MTAAATNSELSSSSSALVVTTSPTSTPGVVAGFTPGVVVPTSIPTTSSKAYYSNDSTSYTTVYGYVTLTTDIVFSTTPYAGGPASVTTSPATVVSSSASIVDAASAASLLSQSRFEASPTLSTSSSVAPNATWVNNWDSKTTSISDETTTVYQTSTIYDRTTLTFLDKPSSTNSVPVNSVNGTQYYATMRNQTANL